MPICKASSHFSAKVYWRSRRAIQKQRELANASGVPAPADPKTNNSFGDRFRDILFVDLLRVRGV